jgi:hypothetical protein
MIYELLIALVITFYLNKILNKPRYRKPTFNELIRMEYNFGNKNYSFQKI